MGCDIHEHYEIRKDGVWTEVEFPKGAPVEIWRNYSLFAILANVRNGYGFAGVKTGEGYMPISEPRGIPSDCSAAVQSAVDYWDLNGHSHSWLTLKELQEYDWDQTTTRCGEVTLEEFRVFKQKGRPESWCGGASGSSVHHVSNETMSELLEIPAATTLRSVYTPISWQETYREGCGHFVDELLPFLAGQVGDPSDLRLVFWFDN